MDIPEEKNVIINAIRAKNNVCVTGAAGTGKSFLLKLIKEHFPYVHVTASTGIAAVNVGGVTVHSWSAIGNASSPAEEIVRFVNSGPGTKIRRQLKKAKLLAIDEISMISSSVLDLINKVFQMVRQNDKAFGGIQLVVLGDFYQLPPVSQTNDVDFCFNSDAWYQGDFKLFELTEVFRQSDIRFIQLLNNIRYAALNDDDLALLNHRQSIELPKDIQPTILVTHNAQADKINAEKLTSLDGEEFTFKMTESGRENAINLLKRNCLAQVQLTLRRGAQVMMLKNTLQKQGIINGSIGIVTGFTTKGNLPIVLFNNGEKCIITPEEWSVEVFNEDKQEKEVNGTIKQLPLALAWAITIHKSQGMTLDNVLCDLSKVFAEGQAYVALSRVRSLEGLYLRGFKSSSLKVSNRVREFYAKNHSY